MDRTACPHRALEQTIGTLQQRWGARAIHRGAVPEPSADAPLLATNLPALDRALGLSGLPRGRLIEVLGDGSAGQGTLLAHLLAQAQRAGLQAVYVDLDRAVDPELLARRGVDLGALTILRPQGLPQALEMTRDLLHEGISGFLTLCRLHEPDLNDAQARQALERALREGLPLMARSLDALVLLTEVAAPERYPPGLALPHYASIRLACRRRAWIERGRGVAGFRTEVRVVKNKLGPSGRCAMLSLLPTPTGGDDG